MTDPALLQALDYNLNHSNEATVEILAEAVVKRRRDLSVFSTMGDIGDPQKMSKEITEKINAGIDAGMQGMKKSVREMIIRILKEHAPDLNLKQINELCEAWLSGAPGTSGKKTSSASIPNDILLSMIEQFVSFSLGEMNEYLDKNLRDQMGAWPKRYWESFPPVVQQIITDYLKDKISDKDFKQKIAIALRL